jgi:hypothetical protein
LVQGQGFKYLYLPQPQWVHNIWQSGFFPFNPPFLYSSPGGYLFVFPPAFQIISSFFYSWFGNGGLYILPLTCMILFWLGFILLLRRCDIAPSRVALGLFVLVFCSPLTLYGATYWEHIPAMLLLLCGLFFLMRPIANIPAAAILGLLSGLAAWLRPEAIMMDLLYGLALLVLYRRERRAAIPFFLASMVVGIGTFLIFNKLEFGSFAGVHGYQVLQEEEQKGTAARILHILMANNAIYIHYYVFALLLLPVLYVLLKFKRTLDIRAVLLIGIAIVYCIITPFILPNEGGRQWGARYFLPVIPVVLLALLLVERQWDLIRARQIPVWLTGVILLFTVYAFYLNTYKGGTRVFPWANNQRIVPSLEFVNRQPGNVVVVSEQYIPMELSTLFDNKYVFLAPGDSSLQRLLPMLKQQGIHQFTYIYDSRYNRNRPTMVHDTTVQPQWGKTGDFNFSACTIP